MKGFMVQIRICSFVILFHLIWKRKVKLKEKEDGKKIFKIHVRYFARFSSTVFH